MSEKNDLISFDNTQFAFEYKNDNELKSAQFLFSSMGKPWLVKLGLLITPWAIKLHLPFTKKIIRNTIFKQFVGGETLEETAKVADKLQQYNVQVILDYGVEGLEGEANFEHTKNEFNKVINYAATQKNIPFISIKITGFARFTLLEKIDLAMNNCQGKLMKRFLNAIESLTQQEKNEWEEVKRRMVNICENASAKNISILVDAEETWIQDPVDALTILMMDTFNKSKTVVFNTIQFYRHDRLIFLKDMYQAANDRNFILGAKLVRGAYMEKERNRAIAMNYLSPIQINKENCDKDYNEAILFCIKNINQIYTIIATHNEASNLLAIQLLHQSLIPFNNKHIHFSQLYGMSDNITFNLAKCGCSVSKYLPFGPIEDVVPYLMRRAQENSSVAGQTGRELVLISKEIKRRNNIK